MIDKKLNNQIEAIQSSIEAAIMRIGKLQAEFDQEKSKAAPNTNKIDTKNAELDKLKKRLSSSLEHALLKIKLSNELIAEVKRGVKLL